MNQESKLQNLTSSTPSKWMEKAEGRKANRSWLERSATIAIQVIEALREQNLKQHQLAEMLKVSPQQISKIVKGQENLTIETIVKLEEALNIQILSNYKVEKRTIIDIGEKLNVLGMSMWSSEIDNPIGTLSPAPGSNLVPLTTLISNFKAQLNDQYYNQMPSRQIFLSIKKVSQQGKKTWHDRLIEKT